jgi:hypothetical protein
MSLRYGLHEQVYFKQLQAAPAQQGEAAAAAGGKELDSQQKLSAGQPEGVHQAVTAGVSGQPVDPGSDADVQPTAAQQSETQEPAPVTTKLSAWLKEPERLVFQEPQSGCRLYPDGKLTGLLRDLRCCCELRLQQYRLCSCNACCLMPWTDC